MAATTHRVPKPRRKKPPTRETYHHGNLRRALIDAALRLVREGGPDAFTMAEAAREAGVSSGAPYRHFPDRKALMQAVALEAEELLSEALESSVSTAGNDAWGRLLALGRAQVAFAREKPSHFRVLFSPEYRTEDDPGFASEIESNRSRMEAASRSREVAAAFAAQCAIYGLARMLVDGQLGTQPDEHDVDEALKSMLAALRGRA